MVLLSFTALARAPLQQVWQFFQDFENVAAWDPLVESIAPTLSTPQQVGRQYKLVSRFNGKQAEFDYEMTEYVPSSRIKLRGENASTIVTDQFVLREAEGGTEVTVLAEIRLKHLPAPPPEVLEHFQKMQAVAEAALRAKLKQLYG